MAEYQLQPLPWQRSRRQLRCINLWWTITCVKYQWYCSIFRRVRRPNRRVRFFRDTV